MTNGIGLVQIDIRPLGLPPAQCHPLVESSLKLLGTKGGLRQIRLGSWQLYAEFSSHKMAGTLVDRMGCDVATAKGTVRCPASWSETDLLGNAVVVPTKVLLVSGLPPVWFNQAAATTLGSFFGHFGRVTSVVPDPPAEGSGGMAGAEVTFMTYEAAMSVYGNLRGITIPHGIQKVGVEFKHSGNLNVRPALAGQNERGEGQLQAEAWAKSGEPEVDPNAELVKLPRVKNTDQIVEQLCAKLPGAELKGTDVKVSNLHGNMDEVFLYKIFGLLGHLLRVRLEKGADGHSSGVATLTYLDPVAAQRAAQRLNGTQIGQRQWSVSLHREIATTAQVPVAAASWG